MKVKNKKEKELSEFKLTINLVKNLTGRSISDIKKNDGDINDPNYVRSFCKLNHYMLFEPFFITSEVLIEIRNYFVFSQRAFGEKLDFSQKRICNLEKNQSAIDRDYKNIKTRLMSFLNLLPTTESENLCEHLIRKLNLSYVQLTQVLTDKMSSDKAVHGNLDSNLKQMVWPSQIPELSSVVNQINNNIADKNAVNNVISQTELEGDVIGTAVSHGQLVSINSDGSEMYPSIIDHPSREDMSVHCIRQGLGDQGSFTDIKDESKEEILDRCKTLHTIPIDLSMGVTDEVVKSIKAILMISEKEFSAITRDLENEYRTTRIIYRLAEAINDKDELIKIRHLLLKAGTGCCLSVRNNLIRDFVPDLLE